MRKVISSIIIAFFILASFLGVASVAAQPSQKVPVIVGFKGKTDPSLIRRYYGDVKHEYGAISAVACSLPGGAIDALERNPDIAYIELDGKVQMTQEEPPPWFSSPFNGVDRIDAELVHGSSITGAGVKVAILDTGIDYDHTDLDANYKGGYDFVNNDNDPMDDHGHGTHVAGIVAAEDNGFGMTGVAPDASLYGVKVLDATGSGDVSKVIAGIQWAIDNEMNIVSMSLRSTKDNQAVHDVCDAAYAAGILVVAAAGNDYQIRGRNKELDTVGYPARYDSVIAVGATDNTDTRASYSSTGSALELVAPGENINSTYLGDTYLIGGGTSMACPHVTGTAALILASNDLELSVSEVRNRLRDTADDLGSPGWDSWYGYGLVDANAMPGAPSVTELTPAVGAFINTDTPTISATVTDVDGIASIVMMLDDATVEHLHDSSTGLVSNVTEPLDEGLHTAALNVSDIFDNYDVTSWSFRVDMTAPEKVTGVTVDSVSSSSLFISWDASTDPDLAEYEVYRKAPGETEYTHLVWVCTYSEGGRAGFFPDTGLEPDANYSYQITAWDIAGNEGDPSDPAWNITAPTPTTGEMHVDRILMEWWFGRGTSRKNEVVFAEAMVFIVDSGGVPVPGATVYGHWENATTGSDSGVTDDMGIARLRSDLIRNPPDGTIFTFVVDTVVFGDWNYNSNLNVETSDSITYP